MSPDSTACSTSRRRRSVASWSIEPRSPPTPSLAKRLHRLSSLRLNLVIDQPRRRATARFVGSSSLWCGSRSVPSAERQQQQPLLVGQHDVAEGDRLAALFLVVGVERIVVVVLVVGAAVGDPHDTS